MAPLLAGLQVGKPPPVGDWQARRVIVGQTLNVAAQAHSTVDGVEQAKFTTTTLDGAELPLVLYRRAGADQPGSAALFLHGGGMVAGWHRVYDLVARAYVAASGVPLLSARYRVAPENPGLIPVEDCYAALCWLAKHATGLGIESDRIGVLGGSTGGGLAAGVALMARDRGGPCLAQQLLLYPMLDDRTAKGDPRLQPFLTWTYNDNITGWAALLGESAGSKDLSPYAVPARAVDLSDLPPTYVDVGQLDIFRDEAMTYARRLAAARVPTEFHLYPGCPHAFEIFAPSSEIAQQAIGNRVRRLKSL